MQTIKKNDLTRHICLVLSVEQLEEISFIMHHFNRILTRQTRPKKNYLLKKINFNDCECIPPCP